MTVKSGFFNSIDGDRLYDAEDINSFFDGVIVDGVLSTIGDVFVVEATTGMQISVGSGKSWFLKSWLTNTAAKVLTLSTAHVSYSRIDIIALDFDKSESVRTNSIIVVEGTPAASPTIPALLNTTTHLQIPLAHILVGVGVTEIVQGNITDKIGTPECPFSQGIVDLIVNVDDVTIEIVSNDLQVKDNGISTAKIASGSVGTSELAAAAVIQEKMAADSVGTAQIQPGAVDTTELATDAVTAAKIGTGEVGMAELAVDSVNADRIVTGGVDTDELAALAVTTAKLAANSVDDTKVGNRVPQFYRRQGGDATIWNDPGTTTYTPGAVRMQGGTARWTGTASSTGNMSVTFPTAYSYAPIVIAVVGPSLFGSVIVSVGTTSKTGFTIYWKDAFAATHSGLNFFWLAIGPE